MRPETKGHGARVSPMKETVGGARQRRELELVSRRPPRTPAVARDPLPDQFHGSDVMISTCSPRT